MNKRKTALMLKHVIFKKSNTKYINNPKKSITNYSFLIQKLLKVLLFYKKIRKK